MFHVLPYSVPIVVGRSAHDLSIWNIQSHSTSLIMTSDLFVVVVAALCLEYFDKDGNYATKGTVRWYLTREHYLYFGFPQCVANGINSSCVSHSPCYAY